MSGRRLAGDLRAAAVRRRRREIRAWALRRRTETAKVRCLRTKTKIPSDCGSDEDETSERVLYSDKQEKSENSFFSHEYGASELQPWNHYNQVLDRTGVKTLLKCLRRTAGRAVMKAEGTMKGDEISHHVSRSQTTHNLCPHTWVSTWTVKLTLDKGSNQPTTAEF